VVIARLGRPRPTKGDRPVEEHCRGRARRADACARDPALVGAFLWWAFDIAVLCACFKAFGESPPGGVIVMGYLTGTLGTSFRCRAAWAEWRAR
jgi:hypothetical protein